MADIVAGSAEGADVVAVAAVGPDMISLFIFYRFFLLLCSSTVGQGLNSLLVAMAFCACSFFFFFFYDSDL